ncbi:MAG: V-type ATP synthase subunit B, partial [Candidatus Hydrogenedentota bacterium]
MTESEMLQKEYWDLKYISGPLIYLENGDRFPTGAILDLAMESGEVRQGQVLEATTTHAVVQVLQGTQGIDIKGTRVALKSEGATIACSVDMIGRRFSGTGNPIDGLAPIVAEEERDIGGSAINPVSRD